MATLETMRRRAVFPSLLFLLACGESPEIVVGRIRVEQSDDASMPQATPSASFDDPSSTSLPDAASSRPLLDGAPDTDGTSETEGTDAGPPSDAASEPAIDAGQTAACAPPSPALDIVFSGSGTTVTDANSGVSAELMGGATLRSAAAGGGVALDGDDDFIQLPSGVLAGLQSVTLSVWFSIDGGPAYVRILDFGLGSTGDPMEGDGSVGRSYLALTPGTGLDQPRLAALASVSGAGDEVAIGTNHEVRDDVLHQVSIVIDGVQGEMRLYLDGSNAGVATLPFELSEITDQNNWLGRSQYDADPYLEAEFFRFQMYGAALTDCQAQSQWQAGL